MLKINNTEYKVLSSVIKYVNAVNNTKKGYTILVSLDFELNDEKGYVTFYVDFFDEKNFEIIENRNYVELPTELDSKISMIEIFDTKEFIDFIDSKVVLQFGSIKNKRIEINLNINDKLININYKGMLDIR